MKLYIDTSDRDKIVIGIDGKRFETESTKSKSQKLLPFIERKLKEQNNTLSDIKEVEVNTGPGSFTGIRVGVSVANALGWALKIPIKLK